ncbi:hypothetical protein, partial [Shigella boydii]
RASAVLLLCHMQQRSAAFHAANAASKNPSSPVAPLRTQSVFSFIDEIYCLRNFPVLVYFVILEAIICLM